MIVNKEGKGEITDYDWLKGFHALSDEKHYYYGWAGYFFGRIPDIRLISNARNPAEYLWNTGLGISQISGIRIVSTTDILPDI